MKTKILLAIITFLGLILGPVSGWCIFDNGYCYATWVSHIALSIIEPLYLFFLYAWPAVLIVLFAKSPIFKSWLKFTPYYIPIVFLLVALTPAMPAPGTILDPFPFYRVNAAELAGQVFSVVTILLVAWKYIAAWRNKRRQQSGLA